MAIHLNYNAKIEESLADKNPSIHYMPCTIKSDGPANVSKYFKPIASDTDSKFLRASFRGYPLHGQVIEVPEGYKGLVLMEKKQPLVDNVERTLQVSNIFDKVTYWNWDKTPSRNDAFLCALDWIDIAEALHAPVKEK